MHELMCDDKYEVCVQEVWKCAFLFSNNRPFFKAGISTTTKNVISFI